jgi:AcrR family transcriptional regulator
VVRKKLSEGELEAFRAKSIAAAEGLFARGGIAAVTMRNLAEELGCSATMPYRYFANHEALVVALRTSAFSRFADHQREEAAKAKPPLERLVYIGRAYVSFARANRDAYRLMFTLEPPKTAHPELELQTRRSFGPLLEAMEEAVGAGGVEGPAIVAAHLFWAELHGLVSLEFADKFNFGVSIDRLLEAFLARFKAPDSDARKARGGKK